MSHRQSGRIFPHQRDANFDGAVLGDEIAIGESYVMNVHNTEQHTIKIGTKRKHRNKIKAIYIFWEKEFPQC